MGDTIRLIGRGQFSSCSDVGEVLEGKPSHSGYFSQGFFESWTEGEGEPKWFSTAEYGLCLVVPYAVFAQHE